MNKTEFMEAIDKGFHAEQKYISSLFFYDDKGSEIFQQIMDMPEYYLTNSEFEIFTQSPEKILANFSPDGQPFEIIELGAGDGVKTKVLLEHFLSQNIDFKYSPIDISRHALNMLENNLIKALPNLNMRSVVAEYSEGVKIIDESTSVRKVLMLLGSNIGNFNKANLIKFLQKLRNYSNPGDRIMLGADLVKDPEVILNAYDDPYGITRSFNMNLLTRINRELGGEFDVSKFSHYANYSPETGEVRSYLISMAKQDVYIKDLDTSIHFDQWETIHTEISKKFTLKELEDIAGQSGYRVLNHLMDCKHYYTDTIWEAI